MNKLSNKVVIQLKHDSVAHTIFGMI